MLKTYKPNYSKFALVVLIARLMSLGVVAKDDNNDVVTQHGLQFIEDKDICKLALEVPANHRAGINHLGLLDYVAPKVFQVRFIQPVETEEINEAVAIGNEVRINSFQRIKKSIVPAYAQIPA